MIKRASLMITILGLVLLWIGANQKNDIVMLIAVALLFTGLSGLYWGFRNMKGSGILRRL